MSKQIESLESKSKVPVGESHTLSIRPSSGGMRKFAVLTTGASATSCWSSNLLVWSQSDQTWEAAVWQRIANRGYVCCLDGDGQWSNRGDHGRYVGVGATAEAALLDAWNHTHTEADGDCEYTDTIPQTLIAPMRDYDAAMKPPRVE